MKVYLYCCLPKHRYVKGGFYKDNLWANNINHPFMDYNYNRCIDNLPKYLLNGKVVGCFELNQVEKVKFNGDLRNPRLDFDTNYERCNEVFLHNACLFYEDLLNYAKGKNFKVWHIENLEMFDEPKELSEFYKKYATAYIKYMACIDCMDLGFTPKDLPSKINIDVYKARTKMDMDEIMIKKAPQSWQYIENGRGEKCILLSVQPQHMCNIANRIKTLEIRKTCPKEFK